MIAILGGGPAGAAAAVAALRDTGVVTVIERSVFPRHKVCGEFLSPEVLPLLDGVGLAGEFLNLQPARVRRMLIHVGGREKVTPLPEPAFGLSRYALDRWLLSAAQARGAAVRREPTAKPAILATGRAGKPPRGDRLFGFKAHFTGPSGDAVELYFSGRVYVGINAVEGGSTNVCGIAPEPVLRAAGFRPDELIHAELPLRRRMEPLARTTEWFFTGPVEFGNRLGDPTAVQYLAGDALSFVDPFTGSGLLAAIATGVLAGRHAARGLAPAAYLSECRSVLHRPFEVASLLRWIARTAWAGRLLETVPGQWLYRATRPRLARRLL